MILYCPFHENTRNQLINDTSECIQDLLRNPGPGLEKLRGLMSSNIPDDWCAFGRFLARARQARRRLRSQMETLRNKVITKSYVTRKAVWRLRGGRVCAHGVFWSQEQGPTCPCMTTETETSMWTNAKFMPALDEATKAILVTPFCIQSFRRIGVLRAQARRLDWI